MTTFMTFLNELTDETGVNSYLDLTGDLVTGQESNRIYLCGECVASYRADEHDLQWDCIGGGGCKCATCDARNSTDPMRTVSSDEKTKTFVIHDRHIVRRFKKGSWQMLKSSGWSFVFPSYIKDLLAETAHLRQSRQ